jgi:hypothetical protein
MCMFCAAVPVVAATGTSLNNKQHKKIQTQASTPKLMRPYALLTMIMILLLVIGSVIVHTRYGWLWL